MTLLLSMTPIVLEARIEKNCSRWAIFLNIGNDKNKVFFYVYLIWICVDVITLPPNRQQLRAFSRHPGYTRYYDNFHVDMCHPRQNINYHNNKKACPCYLHLSGILNCCKDILQYISSHFYISEGFGMVIASEVVPNATIYFQCFLLLLLFNLL